MIDMTATCGMLPKRDEASICALRADPVSNGGWSLWGSREFPRVGGRIFDPQDESAR